MPLSNAYEVSATTSHSITIHTVNVSSTATLEIDVWSNGFWKSNEWMRRYADKVFSRLNAIVHWLVSDRFNDDDCKIALWFPFSIFHLHVRTADTQLCVCICGEKGTQKINNLSKNTTKQKKRYVKNVAPETAVSSRFLWKFCWYITAISLRLRFNLISMQRKLKAKSSPCKAPREEYFNILHSSPTGWLFSGRSCRRRFIQSADCQKSESRCFTSCLVSCRSPMISTRIAHFTPKCQLQSFLLIYSWLPLRFIRFM